MLKIQFKDNHRDPMWIMEKNFSIGSDKSNHLPLRHDSVARFHAKLFNKGDTHFIIKDISNGGVYVNGKRVTSQEVECNDTVRIGDIEFVILDPIEDTQMSDQPYWSLIADSNWLTGQEFPIAAAVGETVVVGRNAECDIVFPGTHLSRKHSTIKVGKDTLTIADLGSSNGTFVNDKPVKETNQVLPGDRIRFDVYSFRVFGPGIKLPTASQKAVKAPLPKDLMVNDLETTDIHGQPKKWKSRPTSPGNREEPVNKKRDTILAWALATIILLGFGIYAINIFAG